jgi:hypothetical protein
MTDRLAIAAERLALRRTASASESVVYSRAGSSVTVDATLGQTQFDLLHESGMLETMVRTDFIIATADLLLTTVQITPQPGDTIQRTLADSSVVTYQVMRTGQADCWRWADRPYRNARRIHTNEIANPV